MTAASDRTSTMPARTVAALRLLASRWLRSCWITRCECCGWGEEDVLGPRPQPPRGLRARTALAGPQKSRGSSKAEMGKSESPKACGHRRRRDTPVPPPSSSPTWSNKEQSPIPGKTWVSIFVPVPFCFKMGHKLILKDCFPFRFPQGPGLIGKRH